MVAGREALRAAVRRIGAELSVAYDDGVVLVSVLKGSVIFLADLVRAMTILPTVDFLAISKYAPGTGRVRIVKDLDVDVNGRDVVLVEDIVDTGLTATYLVNELRSRGPRSVELCALLDRPAQRIVPTSIRFRGLEVGDEFLLGYGLDWGERYRNLDRLVAGDPTALQGDPDAHVDEVLSG